MFIRLNGITLKTQNHQDLCNDFFILEDLLMKLLVNHHTVVIRILYNFYETSFISYKVMALDG